MAEAGYTLVIDWHVASGETFDLRGNDEFDEAVYGEVFDNVGIDGVPFQNCPHFCDVCLYHNFITLSFFWLTLF